MCMFSRPVPFVAKTKIFAREVEPGRQALVYAMDVELGEELAMVLPVPVPEGSADDALRFVDLSGYPGFFSDVERAFPVAMMAQAKGRSFGFGPAPRAAVLEVHEVGDFEASFAPSRADMDRLDPRFVLPPGVWASLGRYDGWGFAVFRLKPRRGALGLRTKRQTIHPMAFTFPMREPGALFFPTVHVHDGTVPKTAGFDHALFAQTSGLVRATLAWEASTAPLDAYVDVTRAKGLVEGAPAQRGLLVGMLPNDDTWLRPPRGITEADVEARGVAFRLRLRATHAYADAVPDPRFARWGDTARNRMAEVRAALLVAVAAIEADPRWRVGKLDEALPPHFFNGPRLSGGTSWQHPAELAAGRPARVAFGPFGDHFEPQDVEIGFVALPSQEEAGAIRAFLVGAVHRALG